MQKRIGYSAPIFMRLKETKKIKTKFNLRLSTIFQEVLHKLCSLLMAEG